MKNPTIQSASVTRHPRTLTQEERDRAAVKRHQAAQKAAHHVMDVIDAISRKEAHLPAIADDLLRNELPAFGPRTGTHPAAKTMDEVVEEIRLKPQPHPPVHHFIDPATIRLAQRITTALGIMIVFITGIALGKAL